MNSRNLRMNTLLVMTSIRKTILALFTCGLMLRSLAAINIVYIRRGNLVSVDLAVLHHYWALIITGRLLTHNVVWLIIFNEFLFHLAYTSLYFSISSIWTHLLYSILQWLILHFLWNSEWTVSLFSNFTYILRHEAVKAVSHLSTFRIWSFSFGSGLGVCSVR